MTDIQSQALNKLRRLKVGALFMELGTGKTKVALDLMADRAKKCDLLVWITPASLHKNFEAELARWQPALPVEVVHCEGIGSSEKIFTQLADKLKAARCAFLVVDESLKIKNVNANRTQRIIELGKFATYKLILNGTPISKNLLDIWAQFQFLSPKILSQSLDEFQKMYCIYDKRGRYAGYIREGVNIPHLIARIHPYVFEAKLDLGAQKQFHRVEYTMTASSEYFELKERLKIAAVSSGSFEEWIGIITQLQKFYNSEENNNRAQKIAEIQKMTGRQAVVFVRWLDSIPAGVPAITGAIPLSERAAIIERFKAGEFKLLYVTYGTGSFGLNLQFCQDIYFLEQVWDYAEILQAEGRIYRLGQKENVNYYRFICSNAGLEKIIEANMDKKHSGLKTIKEILAASEEEKKKLFDSF